MAKYCALCGEMLSTSECNILSSGVEICDTCNDLAEKLAETSASGDKNAYVTARAAFSGRCSLSSYSKAVLGEYDALFPGEKFSADEENPADIPVTTVDLKCNYDIIGPVMASIASDNSPSDAFGTCIAELKRRCISLGGNAVIGMRTQTVIPDASFRHFAVTAYGTIVKTK